MHQTLLKAIIIMVCVGVLLFIAQIWLTIMPWDMFFKAIITLGVLTLLAGFILVIKSDLGSYKKMKDDNYLD